MTLADQLVERLKIALMRNRCPPGLVLPGMHKIAEAARVSEKVVRIALRRLSEDGWIESRRHVGPVVIERGSNGARWRVLYFTHNPYFCYYNDRFVTALHTQLMQMKGGAMLSTVSRSNGVNGYLMLEEALKERWDLILEGATDTKSRRMIETSGWPFVTIHDSVYSLPPSGAASCVGIVNVALGAAANDFVRECARRNVHSVVQMLCDRGAFDITERMRIMGVAVRTVRTPMGIAPDEVAQGAYAIVDGWFHRKCASLPDVILFTDDYLAQGGLLALSRHGVRIPKDVFVVSFANKGHLPIWDQQLTRLEMDPIAHGAALAKAVRTYLYGKPFPQGIVLGTVWKRGETF